MSTRTKGVPISQTLTSTEGLHTVDAPVVLHMWFEADIEMSERFGIEVKALCGAWDRPDTTFDGTPAGETPGTRTRLCGNCTRTRAYRARVNRTKEA